MIEKNVLDLTKRIKTLENSGCDLFLINWVLKFDHKINKVPNRAWLCYDCLKVVKSGSVPENATSKMKSKILKYQGHLKVLN